MPSAPASEKSLFLAALEQPSAADRSRFLDEACTSDAPLRAKVEALLDAHTQSQPLLDLTAANGCPAIGTVIGSYKLLQQIGEGGFGMVYMAEQLQPVRRKVALKILKAGMNTKEVIARFESERQALAMMEHPNIARILDAGTVGERRASVPACSSTSEEAYAPPRPYFVMELVRGAPLTDYCEDHQLSLDERLRLFVHVCSAVQHAHQKGIIHRDLKPSNVMVTLHDDRPVPKVIDFGVAKAMGQQLTPHTLFTAYGQMIGTPAYMSPEQAALSGLDVDTRSDVYSLGVLLYELLTGTTPFDKERLQSVGFDEMRRIIREEEPETVTARIAKTRRVGQGRPASADPRGNHDRLHRSSFRLHPFQELDWIVAKSLEKDRERRYESTSAFASDIERYLAEEPVQACPPTTLYRVGKFVRKHRGWLTAVALLTISLLLGTGISVWQAYRATAAENQAVENAQQAAANEARAISQEKKATALASAEAEQRKQAESNFEAALEAVERMLSNVADPTLNDFPRVGPLRRKMLLDAVDFYQRIAIRADSSSKIRMKIASTWKRIGSLAQELDMNEETKDAYENAIVILQRLVEEQPAQASYRSSLASTHHDLGWFHIHDTNNFQQAAEAFRLSSAGYADLANSDPKNPHWRTQQAHALRGISAALWRNNQRDNALDAATRALDLFNRFAPNSPFDQSSILREMADLRMPSNPQEADDLNRRAIAHYREYLRQRKSQVESDRTIFAAMLQNVGQHLSSRDSEEAEKLLDESIGRWRDICGSSPRTSTHMRQLAWALSAQANNLRRNSGRDQTPEQVSRRLERSDALMHEAIIVERQNVARFARSDNRRFLVRYLDDESRYILFKQIPQSTAVSSERVAARRHQADAYLSEAIQICRTLAAEFPDEDEHQNRLRDLLTIRIRHFKSNDDSQLTAGALSDLRPADRALIYHDAGRQYVVGNDYYAAIVAFTEGLSFDPRSAPILISRGDVYFRQEKFQNAESDYTSAIANLAKDHLPNELASPYIRRGFTRCHLGDYEQALTDFRVAFLQSGALTVGRLLDGFLGRVTIQAPFHDRLRVGVIELLEKYVNDQQRSAAALFLAGNFAEEIDQFDLAREWFEAHPDAQSQGWLVPYRLAVLALSRDDFAAYRQICSQMLERNIATSEWETACMTAYTCGLAAGAVDDYSPAIELARRATALHPTNSRALMSEGMILLRAGYFDDARPVIQASLASQIDRQGTQYFSPYLLAMICHHQSHDDEAREQLRHAQTNAKSFVRHGFSWRAPLNLARFDREATKLIEPNR